MERRAFICHSSADSATANKIVSELENAGIACWIAPRNIPFGSNYAASIVQGIKNSTCVIVVFTKSSNNSEAVINEIEKASALKVPIIPFKIDNEEYSDSLEYYLRSKQSVIAHGKSMNEAIDELIKFLGSKPPPRPTKTNNKWIIPAAIALILLVLFLIYFWPKPAPVDSLNHSQAGTNKIITPGDTSNNNTTSSINNGGENKGSKNIESIDEPNDIPSLTGVGSNSFFFVRKTSGGYIEYSSGQLGGGGSPWQLINNNTIEGSAPAAASIGNIIYLVTRDNNNSLLLCQGSFNSSFGGWNSMNFTTNAKPAITAVGSTVYYFAKNVVGEVFYNHAKLNSGGEGWKKVDGNITAASAPTAASVGNHVFVAVRAEDDKIYYNQADLDGSFNQHWDVMDFQTRVAPAMVGAGNFIYIFAVKTNGEIWFNRAQLGHSFEGWKVVDGNGRTNYSVTGGTAGSANYIFLAMKGNDDRIYLNQGFDRFQDNWALLR